MVMRKREYLPDKKLLKENWRSNLETPLSIGSSPLPPYFWTIFSWRFSLSKWSCSLTFLLKTRKPFKKILRGTTMKIHLTVPYKLPWTSVKWYYMWYGLLLLIQYLRLEVWCFMERVLRFFKSLYDKVSFAQVLSL